MGKYKKNFIFVGISIFALFFYIIFIEGTDKFISLFKTMDTSWLFLGIVFLLGYFLLESIILHIMTKQVSDTQSFFQSMRVSLIGQFFNCITPFSSGGQPMQAYEMHKNGVNLGSATTALLCKFIVYQIILTFYTMIILIFKLKFFKENVAAFSYLALIGFIVNLAVAVFLLSVAFFRNKVKNFCFWIGKKLSRFSIIKDIESYENKVEDTIDTFYKDFTQLRKNVLLLIKSCILTIIQLTFYLLIPFTICRSLGSNEFDALTIMSAAAFVMMISAFVPIPGTIGAAEGTFYIFFKLFFPSNTIYMAILFWRLYTFYLPIIIGALSTFIKSKNSKIIDNKIV